MSTWYVNAGKARCKQLKEKKSLSEEKVNDGWMHVQKAFCPWRASVLHVSFVEFVVIVSFFFFIAITAQ